MDNLPVIYGPAQSLTLSIQKPAMARQDFRGRPLPDGAKSVNTMCRGLGLSPLLGLHDMVGGRGVCFSCCRASYHAWWWHFILLLGRGSACGRLRVDHWISSCRIAEIGVTDWLADRR